VVSDTKVQSEIQNINQEMKEKDVQEQASALNMSYVNLLHVPLNPDLAKSMSFEDAESARAALFFRSGKKLRVAVVDPDRNETLALAEKLKKAGFEVNLSLSSEESVLNAQRIYKNESNKKHKAPIENVVQAADLSNVSDEIENLEKLKDQIEASTFDEALNYVQVGAYKVQASDIHFQPEENEILVRFRVDGILKPVFNLSTKIYDGIVKQIKQLSALKLNVTNIPQDGQYSFVVNQRKINVRVSILPSHYGETVVMRLLDSQRAFGEFDKQGFEGETLRHIREAVQLPHGLILITGPTGSGKTTTMYSMLQSIDSKAKKVITLEDPIEYNLDGITQSQVDHSVGYNFDTGLRAILRQNPDVIMVGEIRDQETAETAAQASLTGHLVITTLHTNSALESISRMVNMGVKHFILAPALELIIAQRLVRRLCDCAQSTPITETEKQQIQAALDSLQAKGVQGLTIPTELKHTKGCDKCAGSGFLGQIAIAEALRFTQELRNLILENKPMRDIQNYVEKNAKMITLYEDGMLKVLRGVTTLEEVYRVAA